MKLQRISLTALSAILAISTPLPPNFSTQLTVPQALAQNPADLTVEAYQLFQKGFGQYQISQYEVALQSWQQALAIYREIKNREGERKVLGNLGLAYRALGNYAKAIEFLQQQLDIAREIQDRQEEGNALGNLGVTYGNLGNYAKAIDYLQQQLNIAREIKDRQGEGNALGSLGNAYCSLGNYAKAIDYLQQQLDIAKEINNRQQEGNALGSLGNAYSLLKNYDKAIKYYQQWLDIARTIKDRQGEGLALNNLALALQESGNFTAATENLIDGIKVRESLRAELGNNDTNKVSIFETQANTYRSLQQVLISQNKTDAALEIAEQGRTRAFVELLASRLAPATITPPTIDQIKQIAKTQNSTLVEYSIVFSELYIWVVKPTGEVAFRKVNLTTPWQPQNISLADFVTSSRESIGVRGRSLKVVSSVDGAKQSKALQQLHKLLIQPIADLLPTDPNAHVIFIPQESLFLVPFAALQDAYGKYLIEKHTILIAPSIQVLDLTYQQRQRVSGKGALIVGNPTMPSIPSGIGEQPQRLASLPGAEGEAVAIAQLLNTHAITGDRATKAALLPQLPSAKIIHLATHGLLDDFKGMGVPGAIALAPFGKDNGLLTASEILDLKLNAELVVLSACDTGRGKITGDGVIGLSRSLISAGVPSVIVSLWSIPDAPTESLMIDFYRNFQQNPDKAQALRSAMLTTMKQHPNPKDWAAFTLIGEAE
jgi:CHAT domain-containing protein